MVSGRLFAAFPHMLQRPAKLMPGAMDVRLYGSQRQVECCGDLLVRAPLDVPQHDAGSILGTEASLISGMKFLLSHMDISKRCA